MSLPLVSLCIPCYNAARWLPASLESALAQTWPACEIIVVDDGSTDNTLAIARGYEAHGVRVVTQPNGGQSRAFNHALRLARGEYIKFFDSDDLLSPDMIEHQVRALAGRPQAVAYSAWARFYTTPDEAKFEPRAGWHDAPSVDWLVDLWRDAQPMMQCGQFLIPKKILDATGGWDEQLTLINDFEFFTRIVLAGDEVVFTPGARLYYRSGLRGSVSGQKSAQAWRSAARSIILGTGYLLGAEDSSRTRTVAAAILQSTVYDMYPSMPRLVADLEKRVAALGGSALAPLGGGGFLRLRRIVGWKAARWLQVCAGKWPRPVRA